MADQKFAIQKQIFEVGALSKTYAHELQNRISHLVHYRLVQKMENYFDQIIPANLLLGIDQLVIDIGEVNQNSMEDEIEERLMAALEYEFMQRLRMAASADTRSFSGISFETIGSGKLQLFEYFLLYGLLPWYADAKISMEALLDELYSVQRPALKLLIEKAGKDINVRKRISYQFSDKSIQQVIDTIEPAEAGYIFETHTALCKLQKEKQLLQAAEKDFSKTLWLFILNYLLAEMSSEFEKKMFVKSNLAQIAAYYNISYQRLLQSFYEVMETEKRKVFQPLKTVIYELFFTETASASTQNPRTENIENTEADLLTLSRKFQLLQYYLQFGSLPVSYEKMTRADLTDLLLYLAKTAPVTLREMLLSLQKRGTNLFYLYQVTGSAESKELVILVLPGKEREIENIASLFLTLHELHPFTGLKREGLNAEIWKYLLDTLLFTGPAVYNEKDIISYLIKRMALMVHKPAAEVVRFLRDSFQTATRQQGADAAPYALFKDVLVNMSKPAAADETEAGIDYYRDGPVPGENEFRDDLQQDRLTEVLHYLLQYGALPWWGYGFNRFSLEELITRRYDTDAGALLLLLRKAYLKPLMKTRLQLHLSGNIARHLMSALPGGTEAVLYIDAFFEVLNESALMKYHNREFVEKTIFSIAWEILASSGYALFPAMIFYFEAITRLSTILQIKPQSFVVKIMQAAEKSTMPDLTARSTILLQSLLRWFDEVKTLETGTADDVLQEKEEKKRIASETQERIIASALIQKHFDLKEKTTRVVVHELGGLLQYFLQWNRLPDSFGFLEKTALKNLLREVLTILFADDRSALTSLITGKANSFAARGYLTELFAEQEGGAEKGMAAFLLQVNLPVFDMASANPEDEKFLPLPEPAEGTIVLDDIFRDEPGMETAAGKRVLAGSKRLLAWFLMYNRFPDDIDVAGLRQYDELLKEIMLFLFRQEPAFIKEQFKKQGIVMAAKLYLYDLLATSHDTIWGRLKDFMQEIREEDLGSLLLQNEAGPESIVKEDWPAFILQILQTTGADNKKEAHIYLLSSPSFAKMLLNRFGMELFLKMAMAKISWPFSGTNIIEQWVAFLQKALASGFYREQLIELFNQFNITFIWGRLNIYSNDSYTIAFIHYLSNQLGIAAVDIFRQLFDHGFHLAGKPVAAMAGEHDLIQRMLGLQIIKLEEIKQVEKGIMASEEKKLSSALKEEITDYAKRQSETLKKEIWERIKMTTEEGEKKEKELKPEVSGSIYIGNAGLVLFHPFMATFFERTGLMENSEFKNEESRNRAVLLLQYLANGKTAHEEHELVLNKILCNVPLEEAIPVSFDIAEHEQDVTAELLEVFIERWEKLKNTSVAGLQNSFIMRDGMLNFEEDHWNLKVEQRGYDILLQTLPWAYGYIKPAWMKHNLIVEWI